MVIFFFLPLYAQVPTQNTIIPLNWSFWKHLMKKKSCKSSFFFLTGITGIALVSHTILHFERGQQSGCGKWFSFVTDLHGCPVSVVSGIQVQSKTPKLHCTKKQKLPQKKQRLYLALLGQFRIARMHLIMSLPLSMSVTTDKLHSSS